MAQKIFYRRTIKVGNSAGVLLPKSLLGADVRVIVVKPPMDIKRDIIRILEPIFEDVLGAYLIKQEEEKAEVLVVSTNINQHIKKPNYEIDIVPFDVLKRSVKEKKEVQEKIKNAKAITNKKLLGELKKFI